MKDSLASAAVAALLLASPLLTAVSTAQAPHPRLGHPNIVPIGVRLKATYPCKVGSLGLYIYSVTVKNTGPAAYVAPATPPAYPLVWVDDQHNGGWPSGWFGQELDSTPSIAPNATATVDVYIPYWSTDPAHMTAFVTHPFKTRSLGYWTTGGMNAPGVPHNSGPSFNVPAPKGCPTRAPMPVPH